MNYNSPLLKHNQIIIAVAELKVGTFITYFIIM